MPDEIWNARYVLSSCRSVEPEVGLEPTTFPITRRMLAVGLDGSRPIVGMIIGMINGHPTESDAKASR